MFVPLFFAGIVVQDRKHYADSTRNEVGREWGGPQTVGGPILIVPVEGDIERKERIETVDRITGDTQYSLVTRRSRGPVDSLVLRPEVLSIDATTASQIRSRGIFQVPVYAAALDMDVTFDTSRLDDALAEGEVAQWDAAAIHVTLSNNAGLRGAAQISGPSGDLSFEPTSKGIAADLGDLRGRFDLSIQLDVNGTDRLMLTPVARDTTIRMTGDWPAPSFTGAFLPDAHDVTDEGFTAQWTIPHLARALPEVSRSTDLGAALGTSFVQVNDFYQKAWRTARYGILFIALTFLSVFAFQQQDRQESQRDEQ
ncbi:MAG: inner membrane CreD family protein, partial [Pseudomonadota bacterium]